MTEPDLNYACSYCAAPEGVKCDANCVSDRLRKAEKEVRRLRDALGAIAEHECEQPGWITPVCYDLTDPLNWCPSCIAVAVLEGT